MKKFYARRMAGYTRVRYDALVRETVLGFQYLQLSPYASDEATLEALAPYAAPGEGAFHISRRLFELLFSDDYSGLYWRRTS